MRTHKIKRIEQFAAGGVSGVVGVSELAVIHHNARAGLSRYVVIASLHRRGFVHIGQESSNHLLDRIRATERAHNAVLG